ncbi:MAG: hypothetical protein GY714_06830 [Desulfobacterales bacterium]|nr:hypothetical protein [Desulfobacterales bacterium]MCP4159940.1 hypothetical protein [Deltaproteobacteria bacterium]
MRITFKIISVVILLNLFVPSLFANQIPLINKRVKEIDRSIKKGTYSVIKVENIIKSLEGVPPTIFFYYKPKDGKLVAVKIHVGHETWSKTFSYYFDRREKILKYLESIDRPDNPPKRAVIYDKDSKVIWKNIDKPKIGPYNIWGFFKKAMHHQIEFSKY